ncbi:putative bifunctional diguanylate cyclase/phosphodiesterase [Actinoplanes utahensis]|uniref:putative bifunctional diguanylate cyclase/phosphodiesterase n=1 Tax=Actinoplanes utahensis TaxID=1869 RepID=UPI001EF162F2|nr:EAL domain-containing protein [Actinoplanes utahensis]
MLTRVSLWAGWLAVAVVAALCFPLLPDDSLQAKIYVNAVGLSSVAAMLVGVRRNRPEHRGAWLLFAAGVLTFVSGDITYDVTESLLGEYPYPSWADALYLGAYPLLWASLARLGRGHGDRERGGLVDAAIISTAIGLIFWVSVVGPTLADAGSPLLERLVTIAYPLADVLLTTAVARMLTRPENRTPSLRLLSIGAILMLTCDLVYTTMSSTAEYTGGFIDSGFLVAYACWGAAALHPSMRQRPDTALGADGIGRSRLTTLALFTLIAPGLLFLQGATGPAQIAWVSLGSGAMVLFLLVVLRMWGLVQQVRAQAVRLGDLAMHDELTGLANRRAFEERLAGAVATGSPTVLLLDLDGFKAINDRFGHAVGDDLLAVVAERIRAEVPAGAVAARMGGDEFAVLLPACAVAGEDLAVRLRSAIHRPVHAGGHDLLVGASIGIADGGDRVEILRRADVAMYAAKADGGRHRRYAPGLDDRTDEEARLGAELRTALDRGEFHLVYQPIVELPHGDVAAVESLIRWWHPERGYVSPDVFIPVAERSGLIVELGEWILRTACLQYADWWRHGVAPERFGVNVSARQLAEPGFAALVAAVLAETGVHPARLVVEVTETAVFGGGAAVRAVQELSDLGIAIALDDFGTGHSSLGLLQTLPVRVLKVDKSFVENVTMAGRHAVIATSLIQVANGLGLVAVAEGVETAEQAAELYRLGYRRAQGHHFGRPAPARPTSTVEVSRV